MAEVEGKVYQFKISLEKLKPPLWRRVLVPGTLPLNEFHKVILCLFGWDGDHCHKFNFRETKSAWGIADPTKRVAELKPINSYFQVGTEVTYVYDFGADWTHYILCENILPMKQAESYPKCTDGGRVNMPEYPEEDEEVDVTTKFKPADVDFSRMAEIFDL